MATGLRNSERRPGKAPGERFSRSRGDGGVDPAVYLAGRGADCGGRGWRDQLRALRPHRPPGLCDERERGQGLDRRLPALRRGAGLDRDAADSAVPGAVVSKRDGLAFTYGGTHVRRTGEIGVVDLGRVEKKGRQNRRVTVVLR
jgi:Threonyl and Alanyl tRNA synthetase second additional domain